MSYPRRITLFCFFVHLPQKYNLFTYLPFWHFWFNQSNSLWSLVTCLISHALYSKIAYSESESQEFMLMRLILSIRLESNYMAYLHFDLLGVNMVNSASNSARVLCFRSFQARSQHTSKIKNYYWLLTLWWKKPLQYQTLIKLTKYGICYSHNCRQSPRPLKFRLPGSGSLSQWLPAPENLGIPWQPQQMHCSRCLPQWSPSEITSEQRTHEALSWWNIERISYTCI